MKPNARKLIRGLALSAILASMLACGGTPTALPATATASVLPTETSLPTQTPVPLYQLVTLGSIPRHETSESPIYTLDAQIPVLQGSDDPRVINFNNEMTQLTQEEIANFKENARMVQPVPGSVGSFIDQRYKLLSPSGNLLSLKFEIMTYIQGAAHPGTHSRTVTYDLEAGADVRLEQLFLPGSDYLGTIARYCIAQLERRDIGFEAFSDGAQPVSENYGSWNITPDGLLITFDEYQVAAYAAGPQEVAVPYAELQSVIDPNGPLKAILP
jgi:hypothetical protein